MPGSGSWHLNLSHPSESFIFALLAWLVVAASLLLLFSPFLFKQQVIRMRHFSVWFGCGAHGECSAIHNGDQNHAPLNLTDKYSAYMCKFGLRFRFDVGCCCCSFKIEWWWTKIMMRFTNVYGRFHFRWHIQNCQFDCVTAGGREREGEKEREWLVRKWCDFISQIHGTSFFPTLFFDRSFSLAVPNECSIIMDRANGDVHKRKKGEEELEENRWDDEIFLWQRNRWCFGASIKRETAFLMSVVWGKIAWIAFVCSFKKSRHSIFDGTAFFLFSFQLLSPSLLMVLTESCMCCIYLPNDVHFECSQVCMFRFNLSSIEKCILIRPTEVYVLHFFAQPISKSRTRTRMLTLSCTLERAQLSISEWLPELNQLKIFATVENGYRKHEFFLRNCGIRAVHCAYVCVLRTRWRVACLSIMLLNTLKCNADLHMYCVCNKWLMLQRAQMHFP